MAENVLETRILLRYDTYSNWMNSSVILKVGEAAVCAFPSPYKTIEGLSNSQPDNTPPAIGIKIGDGYHYFSLLPWVLGIAADVYNWAKSSTKPTYTASEIQNLTNTILQAINNAGVDDIKSYRLIQGTGDNINKYFLQSKNPNSDTWSTDTEHYIDLTKLAEITTWLNTTVEDYWTILSFTSSRINEKLATLVNNDEPQAGKVVTSVSQTNGKIEVTHANISAENLIGTLPVEHGGTGRNYFEPDTVLVGNGENGVLTKSIETELINNNNLATNKAIITYINNATAGLTGAMHFIGEANVEIANGSSTNPQIEGYSISKAKPGDVILYNLLEFVWNGGSWQLLGDEGSYAIKGSITNADIADGAEISLSKIAGLEYDISSKVDKETGKTLTSNDFTEEYKRKLDNIEDNALRNIIEHVYVNGTEAIPTTVEGLLNSLNLRVSALTPEEEEKLRGIEASALVNKIEHIFLNNRELNITTINELAKSVNVSITELTEEEREKLETIEAGAQVNQIEKIIINGTTFSPNNEKEVEIIIDLAALNLNVLEGAQIPDGNNKEEVEQINKKLLLERIAATGNVADLKLTQETYIILNCGSSTTVI